MNSDCVDLIYLDPPFNSNRTYEAPIGSKAAGAAFKDAWTLDDIDVCEHGELAERNPAAYAVIEAAFRASGKGMMAYLIFMAVRLLEMHRILKHTGSIYLHCDQTASHYLKLLMDAVFGKNNFRNELVWCYSGPANAIQNFPRKHDIILFYAKSEEAEFYRDAVRVPHKRQTPSTGRGMASGNRTLEEIRAGELLQLKAGKLCPDWWGDIGSGSHIPRKERTGYPTQKPLALLERIIKASSIKGDLVLDPFCGCATTLVAADRLQRRWVGIDLSSKAIELVDERIEEDRGGMPWGGATALVKPPGRTDIEKLPHYRTHRHRLYGEQEGECTGCDTHFPFRIMEVDHMLPKSRGGTDTAENLQLLCSHCNRSKGDKTMAEWRARS